MKFIEAAIITDGEYQDIVAAVLFEFSGGGVAIDDPKDIADLIASGKNWDYIDESLLSRQNEKTVIKGYFSVEDVLPQINEEIEKLVLYNPGMTYSLSFRWLDDADYINEWKKYYNPIVIGGLVIVPKWMSSPDSRLKAVYIDPGLAFGTGGHATTRMCIELMQGDFLKGATVLDVGSGSGILAMSALKLGAGRAYLIDNDPSAIESSKQNLAHNSMSERAEFFCGNLLDNLQLKADLILANITADILILLSKDILQFTKPDTRIILSGIIDKKLEQVLSCYEAIGFERVKVLSEEGWNAIEFRIGR